MRLFLHIGGVKQTRAPRAAVPGGPGGILSGAHRRPGLLLMG